MIMRRLCIPISDKAVEMFKALGVDVRRHYRRPENSGHGGIATNKGVLVHPKTTTNEIAVLEGFLTCQWT
jgi:translation initiation factor 6 (eIF-6)